MTERGMAIDSYALYRGEVAGIAHQTGEREEGMREDRILDIDERQRDEMLRRRRRARERARQEARRKRLKMRRRRMIRRLLIRVCVLLFVIVAGRGAVWMLLSAVRENSVDNPVIATMSKEDLRETDEWKKINENRSLYPDSMIEVLENNPELLDFVSNYPDAEPVVTGGLTKKEMKEDYPLFLQWDARWGYVPYGDDNIGLSGCAPTCLSMVIFSLTGNEAATPDAIAAFSMDNGYYVPGTGTAWALMTDAAARYGVSVEELSLDEGMMKSHLDSGRMIICSMGPGAFTTTGHFIVLYGYTEEGFLVNDPFSRKRSSKVWDFESIQYQIRNMWVYG